MKQHSIKVALGVALLMGLPVLALLSWAMAQTTPATAQSTDAPTIRIHTESGCQFVANDIDLIKAAYRNRGLEFPTTPDIARGWFWNDAGNPIARSWVIKHVDGNSNQGGGNSIGELGYDEYRGAFQNALSIARAAFISSDAIVDGIGYVWVLPYHKHAFTFVHVRWVLLDVVHGEPVCYQLDTNPSPGVVVTATATPTE